MSQLWDLREHILGGRGDLKSSYERSKPQRVGTTFYGGSWFLKKPCKGFHLVTGGGLCCVKWLKNKVEKGFISYAVIPALYPFWWKFYWIIKEALCSVCSNLNQGKTK